MAYDKGNDIWTMNADGSGQTQVTHTTGGKFANGPVFSPDGTKIAYALHAPWTRDNPGGAEIHVMNADGTADQAAVTPGQKGEWVDMPAWYGGGNSLIYVHDVSQFDATGQWLGDTLALESLDLTSGARQTLAQNAQMPTSASNGTLAYIAFSPGQLGTQLKVVTPAAGSQTILSDTDFMQIWRPRLSPDGQWIVFSGSGRRDPKTGNFLAGLDLPFGVSRAEAHGLPWDPWIIKTDGTGLRRLATVGTDEQALAWSPDAQSVMMSNYDAVAQLGLTGGMKRLVQGGDAGGLDWKSA